MSLGVVDGVGSGVEVGAAASNGVCRRTPVGVVEASGLKSEVGSSVGVGDCFGSSLGVNEGLGLGDEVGSALGVAVHERTSRCMIEGLASGVEVGVPVGTGVHPTISPGAIVRRGFMSGSAVQLEVGLRVGSELGEGVRGVSSPPLADVHVIVDVSAVPVGSCSGTLSACRRPADVWASTRIAVPGAGGSPAPAPWSTLTSIHSRPRSRCWRPRHGLDTARGPRDSV